MIIISAPCPPPRPPTSTGSMRIIRDTTVCHPACLLVCHPKRQHTGQIIMLLPPSHPPQSPLKTMKTTEDMSPSHPERLHTGKTTITTNPPPPPSPHPQTNVWEEPDLILSYTPLARRSGGAMECAAKGTRCCAGRTCCGGFVCLDLGTLWNA